MEQEYDLSLILEKEVKEKLEAILKSENIFTSTEKVYSNHVVELLEISKKLKIDGNQIEDFVGQILQKSSLNISNEKHLKILHFNIINEIERLEKVKIRIEEVANRRVTFYLTLLALLLIVQTIVFYHMIYNVDHLGWDLVEPATFLFSSVLFVLGIFSYVKMHKNAISGEKIFLNFKRNILLKRYIKQNFNIEKFNSLNTQLEIVKRLIKNSKKI